MKPETATTLAVSLLLAGSALCVGGRYTIDRQNAAAQSGANRTAASAHVPEKSQPAAKAERAAARPSDPETSAKRLRAILATSNQADGMRALLEWVSDFKDEDWPVAMEAFDKVGIGSGGPSYVLILSTWTELDPQAAMAWAISKDGRESYVIRAWMGKDPDEAMAFIKSLDKDRSELKMSLVTEAIGMLGGDLPRIGQLLMDVPERSRAMLVQQAHPKISNVPPETLYAWADSFETPLRGQVLSLILSNLQGAEPKLALAQRFPEEIGPEKYGSIYRDWFNADESGVMEELESLQPGPMHGAAVFGIAHGLSMKGRLPEAIALTKRWPEEITQYFLADLLLCSDVKHAPLILAEIPRLKNDELKVNRYHCALEPWLKENPEAARKWLAENEVPEQVRREFEGK
jgi:hypothetical protein